MLEGFELNIVSPEGEVYRGEIKSLLVRTTDGDIGIMKNHINYVSTIEFGMVKITDLEGTQRIAACTDGFVSVNKNTVRIIITTFEFADTIDIARAQRSKEAAELRLTESLSDDELVTQKARLQRATNRIRVYELNQ